MARKPKIRGKFGDSSRNYNFEGDIDKIIINTEARLLAVQRQSIHDMIHEIQTPTAKGGKMRVDTGFLRASGVGAINQIPQGPVKGDKKMTYAWTGDFLNILLAKLKIGDTFYFGWSANYARVREAYDGFLESGVMNWQKHVDKAVNHFRRKDMTK